jgi:ribosomal peptide maturation radical SAM protein 1
VRILLVNMPWALIDVPSLALGILRRSAAGAVPDAEIEVMHANLDYVDWICERRDFAVRDYYFYSLDSYFAGVGDWVFSSALHDDPDWRVAQLAEQVPMPDGHRDRAVDLHRLAPEFIADIAARIIAFEPDLVGFTSTFQQNVAALAAARAVKRAAPHVLTAFGGANCDGAQGEALHRNFGFVDFVIRGEGEASFPQLLRGLRDGGSLAAVPGLCWRRPDGTAAANPMSARPLAPAEIVAPDYDGYFERLEASAARHWVEPKLVVEGARGCWWGQKHHCTFCGLNGSFMEFRSKSPTAFRDEILGLVARHQVLDMFVVDNILDMNYVTSLLPMIIATGYDLRLQYEIKSNLRRQQLDVLFDAGLVNVQPGIENLNSRVLKIMDKGVTGCQNVRMLRDAAAAGLSVSWNYLYGFPGEADEDYLPVIEQLPALHHLPPVDGVARIVIERFSPYFNRPELGFGELSPAPQYALNYDLPEAELLDLAYLFSVPARGVDESVGDLLRAAADRWQREYPHSRLSHVDLGEEVVLVSRRRDFDWTVLRLTDPVQVAVFRLLDQPHTVSSLARKLADPAAGEAALAQLLAEWVRLGIVFTETDHYVQLAPPATNHELLRIDTATGVEPAEAAEPAEPALAGAPA